MITVVQVFVSIIQYITQSKRVFIKNGRLLIMPFLYYVHYSLTPYNRDLMDRAVFSRYSTTPPTVSHTTSRTTTSSPSITSPCLLCGGGEESLFCRVVGRAQRAVDIKCPCHCLSNSLMLLYRYHCRCGSSPAGTTASGTDCGRSVFGALRVKVSSSLSGVTRANTSPG